MPLWFLRMMLAQIDPSPAHIASWLACLAFIIGILNGGWKFVQRMKDKPPPAEIIERIEQRFASKASVEGLQADLKSLREETHRAFEHQTETLEEKIEDSRKERKEDVEALHEKINDVAKQTAGILAAEQLRNQQFASLDGKFHQLLQSLSHPRAR